MRDTDIVCIYEECKEVASNLGFRFRWGGGHFWLENLNSTSFSTSLWPQEVNLPSGVASYGSIMAMYGYLKTLQHQKLESKQLRGQFSMPEGLG